MPLNAEALIFASTLEQAKDGSIQVVAPGCAYEFELRAHPWT
jgi:hypothetical protein